MTVPPMLAQGAFTPAVNFICHSLLLSLNKWTYANTPLLKRAEPPVFALPAFFSRTALHSNSFASKESRENSVHRA